MNEDRTGARGPMNEQPLHLRRMIRAVGKRWLLVLALGWVGCVGGYLVGSRQQSTYVTAAAVLLPPAPVDAQGNRTRNNSTKPILALDGNILQRAGRAVAPPIGVPRMRELIKVRALTSNVFEVRAEARSPGDAALLADAVAKEYVAGATEQGQLSGESPRLVARAIIPTEPSQPKPLLFGAGGALLGLMAGVLLALLSVGRQAGSGHRFHVAQPEH